MSLRNYNKLYVHTDREEGSEKILLGYQNAERETILDKDTETVFHVPYFTTPIKISESTLIQDGATAGPFPAASDRIFKNHKNYSNVTANGSPVDSNTADGTWYCSWLYKDEFGNVKWMDRFYNPGSYRLADLTHYTETKIYAKNDPIFRDEPSIMALEPGVQYRYFHIGEKTAASLVATYGGLSGERLRLNVSNWGGNVDISADNNDVKITTDGPEYLLYPSLDDPGRVTKPVVSFNNEYNTEISIDHNYSYTPINEFSLSFWAYSDDWNASQSTQLVGNFSSNGGYGLFIDTLSSYPFFVIPETYYGHLLYANEAFNPYKDVPLFAAIIPQSVSFDSDGNVIGCELTEGTLKLLRFDNVGKVLTKYESSDHIDDFLVQLICSQDDTVIVITSKARYTFDINFNLKNTLKWESSKLTVAAHALLDNGKVELISTDNVYDSKFIGTTQWCLSATNNPNTNGDVWVKYAGDIGYSLYAEYEVGDVATALAVDPYNRLWVAHGNNKISVYDSTYEPLSDSLFDRAIGKDVPYTQRNISFICVYDRKTNTRNWRCLLYYSDITGIEITPQLYVLDMNGNIVNTVNILSFFDTKVLGILNQDQQKIQLMSKGDFTGYEHKRIFNQISPYNGVSQLIFRVTMKSRTNQELPYTRFKFFTPINNWHSKSWQHIILTLKNRKFELYINGIKTEELIYGGDYDLSYELRPAFFIGSPGGSRAGFNQEIKYPSAIFNGMFEDIKIFDYKLEDKNFEMFQRAAIPAQNMYWSLPTPNIQYMEKIERMFKNKIPGAKSTFFNVNLCGMQIKDIQTRAIIEHELRTIVSKIKPAHTDLLKVNWID